MTNLIKNFLGLSTIFLLFSGCSNEFEKINPELTWETPNDIGVGVPLSENQLNATADVDGTYIYTPDFGTVLEEGNNQELNVAFTPKYPSAFNNANLTVSINVVNKGTSDAVFNESLSYETMVDIDGNAYKTITIGNQTWMAENLRTTHYRNGDPITNITSNSQWVNLGTEAYSSYNNSEELNDLATYGLLYNWFAVSDLRNLAPEGWRVATQADWDALISELGGVNVAGAKLKEAGNTHWNPSTSGNNSSGFTALPSGRRQYTDGTFINMGFNGFWWANTANGADFSFYYQLNFDSNTIIAANFLRSAGYSVRCVKEE
ncbi:fibrobacter succinogenes major paralogous domain-containing protein [Marivirga sp.]|uniref:fibrobacter succinogenes major paralogous domain-containing protein n=1 Tax=Marivirga sp. TaxID=2018662 RepID=UPI0025E8DDD3|nr:fibrobacter succinogenes major paralogous domain-containing protein [Marivirga sp.]